LRNGRFFVVGSSGTPNESLEDAFAADGFSRRLAAAGANALLGLCFDGGILVAILLSKVIYQLVEAFRWDVALLTLIGLLWASANAESLHALPDFMRAKCVDLLECGERLAGLRADPNFAAFEHFFFPDRHGLFDFFNGEAASRECCVAVRR
jgi:hypothetical protein